MVIRGKEKNEAGKGARECLGRGGSYSVGYGGREGLSEKVTFE